MTTLDYYPLLEGEKWVVFLLLVLSIGRSIFKCIVPTYWILGTINTRTPEDVFWPCSHSATCTVADWLTNAGSQIIGPTISMTFCTVAVSNDHHSSSSYGLTVSNPLSHPLSFSLNYSAFGDVNSFKTPWYKEICQWYSCFQVVEEIPISLSWY